MGGAENLRSKTSYKLFLAAVKYVPVVTTIIYILNTLLYWMNFDLPVLSNFSGMSIISWLFIYVAAYVFKFCVYHKLLLYFILVNDGVNIYDYYFSIPITAYNVLRLHSILIGLFFLVLLFIHVKISKRAIAEASR